METVNEETLPPLGMRKKGKKLELLKFRNIKKMAETQPLKKGASWHKDPDLLE